MVMMVVMMVTCTQAATRGAQGLLAHAARPNNKLGKGEEKKVGEEGREGRGPVGSEQRVVGTEGTRCMCC